MVASLFKVSIALSIFFFSTTLRATTFDVANPAEFQNTLTTAQSNGQADTINVLEGSEQNRYDRNNQIRAFCRS